MTCSFRPVFAARGTAIRVTWGASAVRLVTAALLAAGGVAAGVLPVTVLGSARADEVTISTDNMRDGWDRGETSASLTPATLQSGSAAANDRSEPFAPLNQLQRPGLLLLGGSVYAGFGSHCDLQPYRGYIVGVNARSRSQTMWSDESGPTDTQAGIWQSGGGLLSDGPGQILFATGNGISPASGPGTKPPCELAESVVRLAVLNDGTLAAKDFFSPANAPYLDSIDADLGSGGPVGLPFGTATLPHLLVEGGKLGGLFLLNRDALPAPSQGPRGGDADGTRAGQALMGQWRHEATVP